MKRRTKKLLGIPLLILIAFIYAILGVVVYEWTFIHLPNWVQVIYFAVAGFGWFYPATWAIKWMSAPGPGEHEDPYKDL
ncbi:DUF2842 domain-containing protein [Maritalea mediterranea]|uniref:DUF2842 domain-containing protein n=1 Tax=Maritalea mediterranea TaxID=2909667 RepID=A0ABS9E7Q7_9HYPH|nr:DUF2842 domain-containing protein [Maritalea mediterranea]MCF4098214.1 DUF2842 domain-containing protein [Maritalea mediterranea]